MKVGIVAKPREAKAEQAVIELVAWLRKRGLNFVVDQETASGLSTVPFGDIKPIPRARVTSECEIVVVLGGDGTLISVSHYPVENPPLILGVNLGTLGFLTELTLLELYPALEEALAGTLPSEDRFLIHAVAHTAKQGKVEFYALNDVVISKETLARIFGVELFADGIFAGQIKGDGIIVASPSGSTAYSLAAGGSIVHPGVDALLVTPLSPHSLTIRPVVLPGSCELRLCVTQEAPSESQAVYFTIDGQQGMALQSGDCVTIRRSSYYIRAAKSPSISYFELLSSKLKWGNR